ncbi:hypothetical protein BDU57DRAFT_577342, partial [Ampelomyces quisqualis]
IIYNRLFNFLDKITSKLSYKEDKSTYSIVRVVVEKGKKKLLKYYLCIDAEQGYLYNVATILNLS